MSGNKRYVTNEFVVDGEVVESVDGLEPPREGETIEVGAKIDENGERLDPNIESEWSDWNAAEYETILSGVVTNVKRHYHSAYDRKELTVYVELTDVEYSNVSYKYD